VAVDKNQAKVVVSHLADKPGTAAKVFKALADANIVVDMIVQNVGHNGVANLTFTAPANEVRKAAKALAPVLKELGGQIASQDQVAKLSVVGVGMKTHSGVAATLFQALADAKVNIDLISTSEIKITVAIDQSKADEAARAVHSAFGLDKA
jgi:aspartate kinase